MALALAKEFTECSMCDAPLSEVSLYMCTVNACPKFGEVYCRECGTMAHKRQNHKFTGRNIKKVGIESMRKGIQGGMKKLNGALGDHEENKNVGLRQGIVGGIVSLAKDFIYIEKVADAASKIMDIATAATEAGGSGLVGTLTDMSSECMKGVEGAGYAAIAMAGFETIFHTVRFINGDIETWGEYGYHLAKGWTAAGGLWAGNVIGGTIGAAIGSIAGPLGAFFGKIIGGIVGGLVGAKCTRSAFDALFKDDKEQVKRAILIKEALLLFGYANGVNDLESDKFNEKELKGRYKNLAKQYHPDKGGSAEAFHTLTASLCLLMSLARKDDKSSTIKKVKEITKAITWH